MKFKFIKCILSGILGGMLMCSSAVTTKAQITTSNETVNEARASLNNFKSQPIFNLYNETLRKIEKIEDENIKNPMLWELAPYWDEVATKYVTTILDDMIALGKDKNLLSFHELMEKIKTSPLKTEKDNKWNEGYLMGELAAWSASGCLFSKDEVIAIDSINVAWANITHVNIDKAQGNIDKVVNSKSKQWLQGEIDKIKKILKDKEDKENNDENIKPVLNIDLSENYSKEYVDLYKYVSDGSKLDALKQSCINVSQKKDVDSSIKQVWHPIPDVAELDAKFVESSDNVVIDKELKIDPSNFKSVQSNFFLFNYIVIYEKANLYEIHYVTLGI